MKVDLATLGFVVGKRYNLSMRMVSANFTSDQRVGSFVIGKYNGYSISLSTLPTLSHNNNMFRMSAIVLVTYL